MAVEDINFIDIVVLLKITPDTVMERLGSMINASFFDASNIAGTLKQKNLIEFSNDYPGPNKIMISPAGKALLNEADLKAKEPFDGLDIEILKLLATGKRMPIELTNALNLRNKDLALRLYKLYKQNYLIYDLKNGGVELLLTESGFLKIRSMPQVQQNAQAPPGSPQSQMNADVQASFKKLNEQGPKQAPYADALKKGGVSKYSIILLVIVVIVLIALYFLKII